MSSDEDSISGDDDDELVASSKQLTDSAASRSALEIDEQESDAEHSDSATGNTKSQPKKLKTADVKRRIALKEFTVAPPKASSSKIWATFGVVFDTKGRQLQFTACLTCKDVFVWNTNNTSTMGRHKKACDQKHSTPKRSTQTSITTFATSTKVPPRAAKDEMTKALLKFCCKDIRPFEAAAGEGLQDLVSTSMRLGAEFGIMDLSQLMPDPTTVKRHTVQTAGHTRGVLVPELQESLFTYGGGCTLDMWSEQYTSKHFLGVTVHWIDGSWVLKEHMLEAAHYKDEKADGKGIRRAFFQVLGHYSISSQDAQSKLTATTDCGSNIISAMGPNHGPALNWIPCSCHRYNTVLQTLFDQESEKFLDVPLPDEYAETLHYCKSLVKYFKKSGLNQYMTHKLVQEVSTRWFSTRAMLKSVYDGYEEASMVLRERKLAELPRVDRINKQFVGELATTPVQQWKNVK